jgi:hypothetical protein
MTLITIILKKAVENTEGEITNGQTRQKGKLEYIRRRQTKHNTTEYVLDTTIRKQRKIT